MWRLRSLRWRLTLFYAALLLILVTGLGVFVYFQLDHFLVDSSASRLSYQVQPKLNLPPQPKRDNSADNHPLQRLNTQIRANLRSNNTSNPTYVATYNPQGQLVMPETTADAQSTAQPFQLSAPTLSQFESAKSTKDYHYVTDVAGQGRVVVLMLPVSNHDLNPPLRGVPDLSNPPADSNVVVGFIVVAQALTETDAILSQLRLILLLGLAAALLLILLLGLPIAGLGLRPLKNMTATARRIAGGDLSQRVSLKPLRKKSNREAYDDEIRQLTVAFNQMLDQIEAAFAAQRRSEARTRQFVADASHELRSPLTTLGGSIDVLLMQAKNNPAQAEKLMQTMRREIDRISRLVVDLLQLTRLDANGSQSFQFEPVRLDTMVVQACEDFKVVAGAHQLIFEPKTASEVWVRGDADRLRQIFNNLLDNALRYTAPDGIIKLSLSTESQAASGWAILQVQDNGVGIGAEHLPRIFDRFYRADPARARTTGNAGLGLSIIKAIVEAHAGSIEVQSQAGQGTTFTVRLPLLDEPHSALKSASIKAIKS